MLALSEADARLTVLCPRPGVPVEEVGPADGRPTAGSDRLGVAGGPPSTSLAPESGNGASTAMALCVLLAVPITGRDA